MFWTVVGVALAGSPRYGEGDQMGGSYGTFAPPPGDVNRGGSGGGSSTSGGI